MKLKPGRKKWLTEPDEPSLRARVLTELESKRNSDGSWNLEAVHPDVDERAGYVPRTPIYLYALEMPGRPSRWLKLTALSVLGRAGRL